MRSMLGESFFEKSFDFLMHSWTFYNFLGLVNSLSIDNHISKKSVRFPIKIKFAIVCWIPPTAIPHSCHVHRLHGIIFCRVKCLCDFVIIKVIVKFSEGASTAMQNVHILKPEITQNKSLNWAIFWGVVICWLRKPSILFPSIIVFQEGNSHSNHQPSESLENSEASFGVQ